MRKIVIITMMLFSVNLLAENNEILKDFNKMSLEEVQGVVQSAETGNLSPLVREIFGPNQTFCMFHDNWSTGVLLKQTKCSSSYNELKAIRSIALAAQILRKRGVSNPYDSSNYGVISQIASGIYSLDIFD